MSPPDPRMSRPGRWNRIGLRPWSALLLLWTLLPGIAGAATTRGPSVPCQEVLRRLYRAGLEAREAGKRDRMRSAYMLFLERRRTTAGGRCLGERFQALVDLGLDAVRRLKRYREARAWLKKAKGWLGEAQRRFGRKRVVPLARAIARGVASCDRALAPVLTLSIDPSTARTNSPLTVVVKDLGGRRRLRVTPGEPRSTRVRPGRVVVVIKTTGFTSPSETVVLGEKQTRLVILRPVPLSTLTVRSEPKPERVLVKGCGRVLSRRPPVASLALVPCVYRVEVSRTGYRTAVRAARLLPGSKLVLDVGLRREAKGLLTVDAKTKGALLVLRRQREGGTPLTKRVSIPVSRLALNPGVYGYRVVVPYSHVRPLQGTVMIKPGKTSRLPVVKLTLPWYRRTWVWSAALGAVLSGIVIASAVGVGQGG